MDRYEAYKIPNTQIDDNFSFDDYKIDLSYLEYRLGITFINGLPVADNPDGDQGSDNEQ